MRKFTSGVTVIVLMLMARPAFAQFGSSSASPNATVTTMPGFLRQTMARPDIMAPVTRPTMPTPLRLPSLMPTLPNFQNIMLMRNVFGPPQAQVQVVAPPKKK